MMESQKQKAEIMGKIISFEVGVEFGNNNKISCQSGILFITCSCYNHSPAQGIWCEIRTGKNMKTTPNWRQPQKRWQPQKYRWHQNGRTLRWRQSPNEDKSKNEDNLIMKMSFISTCKYEFIIIALGTCIMAFRTGVILGLSIFYFLPYWHDIISCRPLFLRVCRCMYYLVLSIVR